LTSVYLAVMLLLPLAALLARAASASWEEVLKSVLEPRVLLALRLSFVCAACAAAINALFGSLVAWVLTRYRFPGRRLLDALVDLPFALPTAVSGIALATLLARDGWIGAPAAELGLKLAFTPTGIVAALTFIGLPFVVRTLAPAIADLDRSQEEAAASLGASRWTCFSRVLLPSLWPALVTGFALAFARGLGEYGSVIFIAGNMPMRTEIAPLLIVTKLEQYDYTGATVVSAVMLAASFLSLLLIHCLGRLQKRRLGPG
jgi:sulfate transport system permease protein